MRKSITVLFTSAGRRVELLNAFQRAFGSLDIHGRIVVTDVDVLAPSLKIADSGYLVPRASSPDYVPALAEICRREEVDLVFPLIDPDVPILARSRTVLEAAGARVAVIGAEASDVVSDKWRSKEFFDQVGVPAPTTWLAGELDPRALVEYPAFLKPRQGSAAQHTYKIRNARELEFFSEYVDGALVQQFLDGPEITCDVTCDLDGRLIAVVCRKRLEVRFGEVSKGVTVIDGNILQHCMTIAERLPVVGPITVQCMMHGDQPYFTEINGRFGGGVPLGIAAGCDAPAWIMARALDIPVEIPPIGHYQERLYMTRFDQSFLVSGCDYDEMAGRRLRS